MNEKGRNGLFQNYEGHLPLLTEGSLLRKVVYCTNMQH